jgi:hypothetical protein
MSGPLNLLHVSPGDRLELADGSIVEVVENPRDGAWVVCKPVGGSDADKEAVFIGDIAGVGDLA